MIGKFKFFKKAREAMRKHVLYPATSFYGGILQKVGKSKFLNKLAEPLASVGSMTPFVGPFVEKAIQNAPNNMYEYGRFIDGLGEGKNPFKLLHENYKNTNLIWNPLNSLTLPNEASNELRKLFGDNDPNYVWYD